MVENMAAAVYGQQQNAAVGMLGYVSAHTLCADMHPGADSVLQIVQIHVQAPCFCCAFRADVHPDAMFNAHRLQI